MDIKDYLKQLDVSEQESKLRILICTPDPVTSTGNLIGCDPETLLTQSFPAQSFNLALCSNVLFVDPNLSEQYHLDILLELMRVASEVRVKPLLDAHGQPSAHLGPILQVLHQKEYGVELREIKTHDKTHKEALLRLWNPSCQIKTASK